MCMQGGMNLQAVNFFLNIRAFLSTIRSLPNTASTSYHMERPLSKHKEADDQELDVWLESQ